MDVKAVISQAQQAAADATSKYINDHGDGYPCGFAWVNIKPARGALVKELKAQNIGRTDDYYGGYSIWNPSNNITQSMDAKEAGARAFVEVLKSYDIKATVNTRID